MVHAEDNTGTADGARIVRVEMAALQGRRPRAAGSNARLGEHGQTIRVPIVRLTASDGAHGFGLSRVDQETARGLLGKRVNQVLDALRQGQAYLPVEYPLWDLAAKRAGVPVYAMAAQANGLVAPLAPWKVPCYDTTLYFDDLHLAGDRAAADWLAAEARQGYEQGHRAFKIKVGRGARHLPLEQGMQRDIAIVRAVRAVAGAGAPVMVDANNGYNLNLTKRLLLETAACRIHWLEEAFHEDAVLYRDLREWMTKEGLAVLIADGEGDASPRLLDWAREGLVDVVQYDIISWGFTRWLPLARQLADWGARSAPHNYGNGFGNYASCHLAAAGPNFTFVEWDEVAIDGIDASGYAIVDGFATVPATPGFGLEIDETHFASRVRDGGFSLAL